MGTDRVMDSDGKVVMQWYDYTPGRDVVQNPRVCVSGAPDCPENKISGWIECDFVFPPGVQAAALAVIQRVWRSPTLMEKKISYGKLFSAGRLIKWQKVRAEMSAELGGGTLFHVMDQAYEFVVRAIRVNNQHHNCNGADAVAHLALQSYVVDPVLLAEVTKLRERLSALHQDIHNLRNAHATKVVHDWMQGMPAPAIELVKESLANRLRSPVLDGFSLL